MTTRKTVRSSAGTTNCERQGVLQAAGGCCRRRGGAGEGRHSRVCKAVRFISSLTAGASIAAAILIGL